MCIVWGLDETNSESWDCMILGYSLGNHAMYSSYCSSCDCVGDHALFVCERESLTETTITQSTTDSAWEPIIEPEEPVIFVDHNITDTNVGGKLITIMKLRS